MSKIGVGRNEKRYISKGVSPLIASVLLIAFTLSVAMLAGPFFSQTVKDTQESTTDQTQKLAEASKMGLDITSVNYNRTTSNLTVYVQNTGQRKFENISLTVFGDKIYHKEYTKKTSEKRIKEFEISAGDNWNLEKVEASLGNYPVSAESALNGRPAENQLVGYWDLDENSGTWANDSANSNNARLQNSTAVCNGDACPSWIQGVHGSAVAFDGNADMLNLTNNTDTNITGEFTFSAWIKTEQDCYKNRMEVFHPKSDWIIRCEDRSDSGFGSPGNSFEPGLQLQISSDGFWYNIATNITTGQLVHITGVYDGKMQKLYVNGDLKASYDLDRKVDGGVDDPYIGAHPAPANFWNGTIDEIKLWNTALPEKQIKNPVSLKS